MNIAIIDDGTITAIGDYRALFPNTSFTNSGPSDDFLAENNALKVNTFKTYDQATEKLVPCTPYIEDNWVYTVNVEPLTPEDIAERTATQAVKVRADRNQRLAACDWTQLPDAPVDRDAWAIYRQELRDISNQEGFPWDVVWPEQP